MQYKKHAVLLAGGKGTRLKPYTTFFPKPLMPIGDLPIIEVILRQLKAADFQSVTIASGHMAQLLQAFLGDGSRFGVHIDYSVEEKPLGTAGPLRLLKQRLSDCEVLMVMNGDVLTTLDYSQALDFHFKQKADATICLNRRFVDIDFGVIETEGSLLKSYQEKPRIEYDVSMGINLLSPKALDLIPSDTVYHIPDLMLDLKKKGMKVACYQSDCYWLDIGRVDDYATACEIFESRKKEFLPNALA